MLLKLVYDRFQDDGKWAPFILIDRRFRRLAPGHDTIEVARSLPSGLLQPPLREWEREPAGPFHLTLAGVIAATERTAKPWEQSVFLAAVRLAAEIELDWDGTDEDPSALPVLTADAVVCETADTLRLNQLPDEMKSSLITLVGWMLADEPLLWRGRARIGEYDWSLEIDREIYHYAEVQDMETYWALREQREDHLRGAVGKWNSQAGPIGHEAGMDAIAELRNELLPLMLDLSDQLAGQIPIDQAVAESVGAGGDVVPPRDLVTRTVLAMQTDGLVTEIPGERAIGDLYPTLVRFTAEGQRQARQAASSTARPENHLRTLTEKTGDHMDSFAQVTLLAAPESSKVFISHASADRAVADLIKDSLVLGGVHASDIFYSSDKSTGIATGNDLRPRLQTELQKAAVVIEILTETFFKRPVCLMELGGAWALGKPTYPIIVPPTTIATAKEHIGETLMASLGTDSDIDDMFHELPDELRKADSRFSQVKFEPRIIRQFKERLSPVLTERANQSFSSAPGPAMVGGQTLDAPVHVTGTSPTTVDPVLQRAFDENRQHYKITDIVQQQVDAVLALGALTASVNIAPSEIPLVHTARLSEIQAGIKPLLKSIAFLAQRGDQETDNLWLTSISQLSEVTIRDGSAALNLLSRAPAVLAFHTAGIAACIRLRDDLVGRLLGENISILDAFSGAILPAATALGPEVIYTAGWPSKALHAFLATFFEDSTSASATTIHRAWERWTFLYHVARECLKLHGFSNGSAGYPYLTVVDDRTNGTATEVGRLTVKEIALQGDSHGLFLGGMGFVGDAIGFEECAKNIEHGYGREADAMDWRALPNGSGSIPTGRHYPGQSAI